MYNISRYEQTGEQLFICINHTEKPVYIEHFFTDEEKLDVKGTIEHLVAELSIKADEYVEPEPTISKLEEVENVEISKKNIDVCKQEILAECVAEDEKAIDDVVVVVEKE